MIDSHIHLSYRLFDQVFPYVDHDGVAYSVVEGGTREALIEEMKHRSITECIEPAIDVDSNLLLLDLSRKYKGFLYPAVGNHPTRCTKSKHGDFKRVREFAKDKSVIAIGEAGLDYHVPPEEQRRLKQKRWFRWQIKLAHKLGLPLILHIRLADEDAIRILRRYRRKLHGGVCHCFSGGPDVARIYTEELGMTLGIGGTLLMKREYREPLEQTVISTPLKYLLLETDAPYVKPLKPDTEAITGKKWQKTRNTSLILPVVAERIAELKGISVEEVLRVTEENTRRVFGI